MWLVLWYDSGEESNTESHNNPLSCVVREEKPGFFTYLKLKVEGTPETRDRSLTGKSEVYEHTCMRDRHVYLIDTSVRESVLL